MRLLISALPLVGCVAMSLLCRRMGRQGHCSPSRDRELHALRAEVADLRATSATPEPGMRR